MDFVHSRKLLLKPVKGSSWAGEMVLNPAILKDRETGRIHMLFRATGPCPQKQIAGKPLPYPIFLGYGYSDDNGETWHFDTEKPALAPNTADSIDEIYITNIKGEKTLNYANGCIEDPRMFYFEDNAYVTTACRMFPPGPYWEHDEPMQCAPSWALENEEKFNKAITKNYTVNVLWQVDLKELANGNYDNAFKYVTNLTDPAFGEDRDIIFFPYRLNVGSKKQIVMIHRPVVPGNYPMFEKGLKPSIVICAADNFEDFADPKLPRTILAQPIYEWEGERIGASAPMLSLGNGEWLLPYHGKKDEHIGYTQSFMIIKEQKDGLPVVTHRTPERMIYVQEDWEMPNKFPMPCIFSTGLEKIGNELLMCYGAADEYIGQLKIDYDKLIEYIRKFKI